MTANVIEATMNNGSFVAPGGGKGTLSLLLATRDTRDIRARSRGRSRRRGGHLAASGRGPRHGVG
jgi:hypothetical protein